MNTEYTNCYTFNVNIMTEQKFKVGDKWKRRDGKIVEIIKIEDDDQDYPILAGGEWYDDDGFFISGGKKDPYDLIEKIESAPSVNTDHTIANFQAKVFGFENNPDISDSDPVQFPLSELATIARKLYDYEKFISELKDSLKDGDEKRRILREKIEKL